MKLKVLCLGGESSRWVTDPEIGKRWDVVSLSKMPESPITLRNQGFDMVLVDSNMESLQDVCFLLRFICRLRVAVLLRSDANANDLSSPDIDVFISQASDIKDSIRDLKIVAEKGTPEFSPIKVLSVEDDRSIKEAIKACFRVYWPEATLRLAERGVDAVRIIADDHPSIILLDLGLPDFSGLEVLNQIKSFCDIPIIVVTANATEAYVNRAIENGARDFVAKPFTNRDLMHRVTKHVSWRSE